MKYELKWVVPERVLLAHVRGSTTVEDVRAVSEHIVEEITSAGDPSVVHIISDVTEASLTDPPVRFAQLQVAQSERVLWSVVIGSNKLLGLVVQLISRVTPSRMHYVTSYEDAIAFLADRDAVVNEHIKGE